MKVVISIAYLVLSYYILYATVVDINEHENPLIIALGLFVSIGFIIRGMNLSR